MIWYFYIDYKEQNRIDKELLENLNLQLTGVIDSVDVFNGYGGFGIIRLKIISSNMDDYDPRPDHAFYYCVIKKGTAEIYAPAFGYG